MLDASHEKLADAPDAVIATIPVSRGPYRLALSPDGQRLYVAHFPFDTVSVIDLSNTTVIDSISVPDRPRGVAVGEKRSELYVTSLFADQVSVFSI